MIEFYIIGSMISFYKFNNYIDYKFDNEIYDEDNSTTKCKQDKFKLVENSFNRLEFLSVFLYTFVYTMFIMIGFIYGVYLVEFCQWYFLKKKKMGDNDSNYVLLKDLAKKSGKYNKYFEESNLFIKSIFKVFLVSFIMNFVFINILILFRGSTTERIKKKVKMDYFLLIFFVLTTSVLTFIFV
jgi:hypothetical protein